jgi:hypothetical protein
LESVDKVNNMGVTISDDLKWESHINNICGKANKTLGFKVGIPYRTGILQ